MNTPAILNEILVLVGFFNLKKWMTAKPCKTDADTGVPPVLDLLDFSFLMDVERRPPRSQGSLQSCKEVGFELPAWKAHSPCLVCSALSCPGPTVQVPVKKCSFLPLLYLLFIEIYLKLCVCNGNAYSH